MSGSGCCVVADRTSPISAARVPVGCNRGVWGAAATAKMQVNPIAGQAGHGR